MIATLRKIEADGKHETCYRIHQRIEAIFDYAEVEEHCTRNPAQGVTEGVHEATTEVTRLNHS